MSNRPIFTTSDLGAAIKAARKQRRLTQSQLADHANLSRGVVQKLEEGRGTVALDNAVRILNTLSLDLTVEPRGNSEPPATPSRG